MPEKDFDSALQRHQMHFSLEKDATTDLLKCVADLFIRKMKPLVAQGPIPAVVP